MTRGYAMHGATADQGELADQELMLDELLTDELLTDEPAGGELELGDEALFSGQFPADELPLDELLADELTGDGGPAGEVPAQRRAAVAAAVERQRRRALGFGRAVRGLRPYLRRRGAGLVLAVPPTAIVALAGRLGIQPRGVAILVRSAARARPIPPRPLAREVDLETGDGCLGRSAFSSHWWGNRVLLNSCQTRDMLTATKAGAGIAAICAAAVPQGHTKIVCGVIGAALTLGVVVIEGIHSRGGHRGIIIRQPWVGPPVVWHQ